MLIMAEHRDNYINIPKYSPEPKPPRQLGYDMPEFKIYQCDTCHIKVSTSNGCCPCCGKTLA